jgi:hypothetical protein
MPTTTDSQSSIRSSPPSRTSTSSYFTYPVSYAVTGLLRRLSTEPSRSNTSDSPAASGTNSLTQSFHSFLSNATSDAMDGVYTPPRRKASPFQPPPLTPLTLNGYKSTTKAGDKLLSKALAEEIRLLVPPRLQLVDEWELTYSIEQNGVSLATLYEKVDGYRGKRGGFVLVVRDSSGGVRTCIPILTVGNDGGARLTENRYLARTFPTHHTPPHISSATANASFGAHPCFLPSLTYRISHLHPQQIPPMPCA